MLFFAYMVLVCDLNTDGVSVGDGNDDNGITGGSITAQEYAGVDFDTTFSGLPDDASHLVDGHAGPAQ